MQDRMVGKEFGFPAPENLCWLQSCPLFVLCVLYVCMYLCPGQLIAKHFIFIAVIYDVTTNIFQKALICHKHLFWFSFPVLLLFILPFRPEIWSKMLC